jgi:hypothetical protein
MLGRWFKPDPERDQAAVRVKAWVHEALRLDATTTVSVNEIECGDPACPGGVETVILVRGRASVTAAMKIPGPITAVTAASVADAIRSTAT